MLMSGGWHVVLYSMRCNHACVTVTPIPAPTAPAAWSVLGLAGMAGMARWRLVKRTVFVEDVHGTRWLRSSSFSRQPSRETNDNSLCRDSVTGGFVGVVVIVCQPNCLRTAELRKDDMFPAAR